MARWRAPRSNPYREPDYWTIRQAKVNPLMDSLVHSGPDPDSMRLYLYGMTEAEVYEAFRRLGYDRTRRGRRAIRDALVLWKEENGR